MGVGQPGAGQWVTIYAGTSGGQGHTFIEVAGIVLDTVHGIGDHARRHRAALAARVRDRLRARQRLVRHPTPPRTMTRPRSLLAVAACLLALAGCGGSHSKSDDVGRDTSRVDDADRDQRRGEHAAASLFAAAYVRFLDGAGTASGLPDATAGVRALAGRAGSIPAARRRGTLVMTQLRPAVGAAGSYLLTARDDAHAFYAQMTLAEQHGHWLVVELTPPDFVQVFAPAGPPPPAPPPGSAAAENAARLFLRGYLPWLYGHAPLQHDHRRDERAAGEPEGAPAASASDDAVATTEGRSDRDAAPRPAAGRRFRTSTTGTRPTSSCSRSRTPAGDGSSPTSAPTTR